MHKYCEIVKSVFLNTLLGDNGWEYKIEIYKKPDGFYYSRLFRSELFKLTLNYDEQKKVSENIYVYEGHTIPILEERAFDNIDNCLNFAVAEISKTHEIIDID